MLKEDIILTLRRCHVTRKRFAELAGVPYQSFCNYLRGADGKSITERVIPFIYGDRQTELEEAKRGEQ